MRFIFVRLSLTAAVSPQVECLLLQRGKNVQRSAVCPARACFGVQIGGRGKRLVWPGYLFPAVRVLSGGPGQG